ncbi:ABC transporter ced-7, partial [Aphelenchoides avenae]
MDPGARFQIREILEKVKHDRTIVLTTHYMDEADALADRVAIMVKGEIVCNGSPEFLKKKFGTGYVLTVSLSVTDNVDERVDRVLSAVKAKVDGAKLESSPAPQFNVLLPFDQKKNFADLFEEMETRKQALGIESFGLSVNALEQVFIRVGELVEGGADRDSERARCIAEELCNSTEQKSSGIILLPLQFIVLLQRYFLYAWRHKIRTLIPFVVVILLFIPFMANAYEKKSTAESGDRTYDIVINANQLVESVLPVVSNGNDPWELRSKAREVASNAAHNLVVKNYGDSDLPKEFEDGYLHAPPLGVGLGVDGEQLTAYFNQLLGIGWALSENFMANAMAGKGKPDTITSGIKKDKKPEGQSRRRTPRSADQDPLEKWMTILAIFLSLSLAVSLTIFTPVAERSTKFKHQLFLARVPSFLYWTAQLVGDFIHFLAVALLVFAFTWAFTSAKEGCAAGMLPLWLLYFLAASMITYCLSFKCASPTKAYALMLCWHSVLPLITGGVIMILMQGIMAAMASAGISYKTMGIVLYVSFCLAGIVFPAYPLSIGLVKFVLQCPDSGMSWALYWVDLDVLDRRTTEVIGIGPELVVLALSTVIFAIVLTLVESRHSTRRQRKDVTACELLEHEDEDVTKERERMLETSDFDLALSVRDLYKFFGSLCAVRKLTFGVGRDDCFGLVGVNGAGKTTTFDILTGVTCQSSGSATVEAVNVLNRPAIGYCPQVDALSPDLTGRETLTLIGLLNGLKGVKSRVEKVLESIRLADQGDKLVEHCSGGQKRRISIGVALMSSSKLIMLDEPTAGVDPRTRRYVWDLLTALRRQNVALLLTSHSMEECEA